MSKLIESIKANEGYRAKVYLDTLGYPTVGIGFKVSDLSDDELAVNGGLVEPMSLEVAEKILQIKLDKLTKRVYNKLPWLSSAPADIQDVIIEMAYQLGINGMLSFKNTLEYMRTGNYSQAAENMLKSKWATQTPNRVRRLANQVRNS